MAGSISLLIDSPLRDLAIALRAVGPDVRKQISSSTKSAALPIWKQEVEGRKATSRLAQRALISTARVGVTSQNVTLRSGGLTFKGGKSAANITRAAEFGGDNGQLLGKSGGGRSGGPIRRGGSTYRRRQGATFGPRYSKGRAIYPAASDSIPRFASLWVQTARRTIHEAIEKGAS